MHGVVRRRVRLTAHKRLVIIQTGVNDGLDNPAIQTSEATGDMAKAEDGVAAHG